MRGRSNTHMEEGSVTPAVAMMMAAIVALAAIVASVVGIHVVRIEVQTAADLAALASGQAPSALMMRPPDPSIPCGFAREVAERNGTELVTCSADGSDIRVVVERRVTVLGLSFTVAGRARAGPIE